MPGIWSSTLCSKSVYRILLNYPTSYYSLTNVQFLFPHSQFLHRLLYVLSLPTYLYLSLTKQLSTHLIWLLLLKIYYFLTRLRYNESSVCWITQSAIKGYGGNKSTAPRILKFRIFFSALPLGENSRKSFNKRLGGGGIEGQTRSGSFTEDTHFDSARE
jgi:hypothetical protein